LPSLSVKSGSAVPSCAAALLPRIVEIPARAPRFRFFAKRALYARFLALIVTASLSFLSLSWPAQAGLIGNGTNSVQALFHFFDGTNQVTVGEPETNPATPVALNAADVTIPEGALDGVQIDLFDTKITLTNEVPSAFCSSGAPPCAGEFWAFEFQFSSGVNIAGVSLDASTAADFQPTGSNLDLVSPTDVQVEVTGDNPAIGDPLTLDLTFPAAGPSPSAVPEPKSVLLFVSGLIGLLLVYRRGKVRLTRQLSSL